MRTHTGPRQSSQHPSQEGSRSLCQPTQAEFKLSGQKGSIIDLDSQGPHVAIPQAEGRVTKKPARPASTWRNWRLSNQQRPESGNATSLMPVLCARPNQLLFDLERTLFSSPL